MPRILPPHASLALVMALALGLTSCAGTRKLADPTVMIQTEGGVELGVSTDYGLIFLGRTATAGRAQVTAWFGDGPNVETTAIEPLGGNLFTAETEIRLPSVPMTFIDPAPGEMLLVRGRTPSGPWEAFVRVRHDPRVYGILLDVPKEIMQRMDQTGAGVFWVPEDGDPDIDKRLIGLVTGRLRLETKDGTREYLTVMGPEQLWRLVTHRRDHTRRKPWVYREDIM